MPEEPKPPLPKPKPSRFLYEPPQHCPRTGLYGHDQQVTVKASDREPNSYKE